MAEQRIQIPAGGLEGPRRGSRVLQARRRSKLTSETRARISALSRRGAGGPGTALVRAGTQQAARTGLLASGAQAASKAAPGLLRRLGPLAALIVPFVGLEGLRRIQELRGQGRDVRSSLEALRNPANRASIIQDRLLKERLQENIIAAKLVRMQNVARNDPGLFKLLSGMVVGSRRPRTTPQTVRIGPEPSQLDLLSSGLF